ncbi:FRG domain-containing protein [Amylibacter sp. SFDW26]|uniref:FRG domain-containing protein n=1 Tax=Amylibacter sp. SFDW26 TaxID=2652722 RepID=UPI0012623816|nr:FRG domain-containing protein [Amylibacter sp. SFDW26]KAB7613751.1 FRG domain-containing protein [Amylibacter sp. SFDW26]
MLLNNYSAPNFDWSENPTSVQPRADLWAIFNGMGFSKEITASLISSGYVVSEYSPVIIDRFHGGPSMSSDGSTRFSTDSFKKVIDEGGFMNSPFPVHRAKSEQDVREFVKKIQTKFPTKQLCFRGQTSHYTLNREVKNPKLNHPDLGETSLVPSVWRHMLNSTLNVFPEFVGIPLLFWSSILYKMWPMDEIHSREKALQTKGEWLYTASDMEDCSDELLRAFGKFRLDLLVDEAVFQTGLLTMMQHYGLPTPFLDLTSELDVAIFFATHKFGFDNTHAAYDFAGTNGQQSIIYVLSLREVDMHTNERNRVMQMAKPERPRRQSCVVCSTNAWSINLPADYIVGAILMDYEMTQAGRYGTPDLFPSPDDDPFLKAWMSTGEYPLTVF